MSKLKYSVDDKVLVDDNVNPPYSATIAELLSAQYVVIRDADGDERTVFPHYILRLL